MYIIYRTPFKMAFKCSCKTRLMTLSRSLRANYFLAIALWAIPMDFSIARLKFK